MSADQMCLFNIQRFSIHDGPGIRTAVFFKGCPLRCKWCSNPESQAMGVQPERDAALAGKWYTLDEVLNICLADQEFFAESGGGVTLSGGEVLSQPEAATNLLCSLSEHDVHTALETTGYTSLPVFSGVIRHAELLLYDIKHYDDAKHREGTGVDQERIIQNLCFAYQEKKEILIRIPIIPDYNDSLEDAKGFAALLNRIGTCKVQLLPFHQFGQKKYDMMGMSYALFEYKNLHVEDLLEYRDTLNANGIDCSI